VGIAVGRRVGRLVGTGVGRSVGVAVKGGRVGEEVTGARVAGAGVTGPRVVGGSVGEGLGLSVGKQVVSSRHRLFGLVDTQFGRKILQSRSLKKFPWYMDAGIALDGSDPSQREKL